MIVDHVIYRNGERVGAGEAGTDGVAWLSFADPTPDELEKLGRDFGPGTSTKPRRWTSASSTWMLVVSVSLFVLFRRRRWI